MAFGTASVANFRTRLLNERNIGWLVRGTTGVGPVLADTIVKRRQMLPFTATGLDSQLQNLKGVGAQLGLQRWRARVCCTRPQHICTRCCCATQKIRFHTEIDMHTPHNSEPTYQS